MNLALLTPYALVVFHETIREVVRREMPGADPRVRVIAQSVACTGTPGERGRRKVAAEISPEKEIEGHRALYRSLVGIREA